MPKLKRRMPKFGCLATLKMKYLVATITLLLSMISAFAQYGNEWISYDQTYFKFKTLQEGIYRLDYNALDKAGLPVNSIDPRNIQIFHNGQEQFLTIVGESDGSFDSGDHIELFCTYNDGKLDEPLFRTPSEQGHQYTSFYQDSAVYFLTWSTSEKGKRYVVNSDIDYSGLTPDPSFMYESVRFFTDQYIDGLPYGPLGYFSEYTEGEGYLSKNIGGGTTFSMPSPLYDSMGPMPKAYVLAYSESNPANFDGQGNNHEFEFKIINGADEEILFSKKHRGYNRIEYSDLDVPKRLVQTNTQFRFASIFGAKGRHVLSLLKLLYPRKFDLENESQFTFDLPTSNNFIRFDNYPTSKSNPIAYNLEQGIRYSPTLATNQLKFKTTNEGGRIFIVDETDILSTGNLSMVTFKNYATVAGEFSYLMISHTSLKAGSDAYKTYRESTAGGSLSVLLANADQLYDEFYYGVHHPLALRNWINFIYDRQSVKPKHLLLLGKAYSQIYYAFNSTFREKGDLVPTMGIPASDYLFTSSLDITDLTPKIATGRIPANTNEEIYSYLDKVKSNELNPITSKKVLQLAGGIDQQENLQFEGYLNSYGQIIAGDSLGGNTLLLSKRSAITIDASLIDQIIGAVSDGVTMINYFGHGASSVTEIDLGRVQNYQNPGKYPLFFFDGCALGNTFNPEPSLAEEFIFEPNKGAIGWVAGSFYGFASELRRYTSYYHNNAFRELYGSSIGEIIAQTISDYQNVRSEYNVTQCRVMLLHGDPAIRLYNPPKADYTVDAQSISLQNERADLDSFKIEFQLKNLGKLTHDSVPYILTVTNQGQSIYQDSFISNAKISSVPLLHKLSKDKLVGGINSITVRIDPNNQIDEMNPFGELNNVINKDVFVSQTNLEILSPVLDEIVSKAELKLKFTNYQVPIKPIVYNILVDTTPNMNSALLFSTNITSADILVDAVISLPPLDSSDFFISVINVETGDTVNSSFAYIFGSASGLSQGEWSKFKAANSKDLDLTNRDNIKFNRRVSNTFFITTSGSSIVYTYGRFDRFLYEGTTGDQPGMLLIAFNEDNLSRYQENSQFNLISNSPWKAGETAQYYAKGSYSCLYRYNTNLKRDRDSLTAFLNRIPSNYYLCMVNESTTGIDSWEEELFQAFESFGASDIRQLTESHPYILWGKKSFSSGEATEVFADMNDQVSPPKSQIITFSTTIYPFKDQGSMISRKFGPAKKWSMAYVKGSLDDLQEKFNVQIVRYDINEQADTVIYGTDNSKVIDLSTIDASVYPYIKIQLSTEDVLKLTPFQLYRWSVLFDPLPEGFAYVDNVKKDTIDEGGKFQISSIFRNISDLDMDSVVVQYNHYIGSTINSTKLDTIEALSSGDSIRYSAYFEPMTNTGDNSYIVSFNPGYAQPEQSLSNNGTKQEVYVKSNGNAPLLNVYFDNQQILNGQIINPNAKVSALGRSNHPNMFVNGPELYFIYFIKKGEQQGDTILWTNPTATFTEETASTPARFDFNFENLEFGKYTLLARLSSPTESGSSNNSEYSIEFEVSAKNEITQLLPYPNPMVTSCRFAYSYGGRTLPTKYHLSLFNISGRLVREVDQFEFGPLKYGSQLSDFIFDGKDNYGDQLANGVYLYKFEIQDSDIKESSIDQYFTGNFGKIFISR
jgi:Peptidase family C25